VGGKDARAAAADIERVGRGGERSEGRMEPVRTWVAHEWEEQEEEENVICMRGD
jgi:hypothetical protein